MASKLIEAASTEFKVLDYKMPRIEIGVSDLAVEASEAARSSTGFSISEVIRQKTGLKERELKELELEIERKTLEKLKEVQENAYAEAFELGRNEGRAEAFLAHGKEIEDRLSSLDGLVGSIETLKGELLLQNESHLVKLMFQMAKRLAAVEVETNPEVTLEIIRQAIELAQTDEEITIRVAPQHLEFIEEIKKDKSREFEFIKKAKIEASPEVGIGGCVLVTNYGEIDSKFETRMSKLWESLKDSLHRNSDLIKTGT
jgi:flagellar assembly protein FliH